MTIFSSSLLTLWKVGSSKMFLHNSPCMASSQSINYDNSAISYSKNVDEVTKEGDGIIMGILQSSPNGKY